MPFKYLACEFCNKQYRKDRIAQHVKHFHVKELGNRFLSGIYPLEDIARNRLGSPIYVKDSKSYYYFGQHPKFFEENDDSSLYCNNDTNIEFHKNFIEHIVSNISLLEFWRLHRKFPLCDIDRRNRYLEEMNAKLLDMIDRDKRMVSWTFD
jgi:hypothetical protein